MEFIPRFASLWAGQARLILSHALELIANVDTGRAGGPADGSKALPQNTAVRSTFLSPPGEMPPRKCNASMAIFRNEF